MSGGGKVCESCKSGKAMLYCRVDSVFLCMGCDNRIHNGGANEHERVWICDVCEQAPGSVTCKADAAVLCVNCDRDIHSVNPLALRHERYPVSPFYHSSSSVKTTNAFNLIFSNIDDDNNNNSNSNSNSDILVNSSQAAAAPENYNHKEEDQVEAAHAWMSLPNSPPKKCVEEEAVFDVAKSTGGAGAGAGAGGGDYFFSDADPYFDLDYVPSVEINFHNNHKTSRTDGVVPEQKNSTVPPSLPPPSSSSLSTSAGHGQYYIDFSGGGSKPLTTTQSYYSSTTTPKSLAKTDAGVVPDGNSIDGGSAIATQLCGLDREARVLRYREKRKNRKFEKTIRYASRKAYAETRPRVKGRFVPMGTR